MSREQKPERSLLTLATVSRMARETLLESGSHVPVVLVEGSRETLAVPMDAFLPSHRQRRGQMFRIGFELARQTDIGILKQVYLVSEAWMSPSRDGHGPHMPPSQDPKRSEVLIINQLDTEKNTSEVLVYEMQRDADGELRDLKPYQSLASPDAMIQSHLLNSLVLGYATGLLSMAD